MEAALGGARASPNTSSTTRRGKHSSARMPTPLPTRHVARRVEADACGCVATQLSEKSMTYARLICAALGAASLFATAASAAPTLPRAWVSGVGADSSNCGTVDSPCRTFQYAHDNIVASGGSIYVKDPANYGQVVISKSISLINDGSGTATIFAPSGNAIAINSGASDVLIRGLTLDGSGSGTNGVAFTSNGTLTLANCIVRGFAGNGLSIVPSSAGAVAIVDSLITGNGTAGVFTFGDSSGTLTLTLSRDRIVNNGFDGSGYGVRLTGGGAAFQFSTIDSTLIGENSIGLSVEASGSNIVSGALFDSKILGNKTSIAVTAGASVRLEKTSVQAYFLSSSISNNGSIVSFGDNAIVDSVTGNAISTTPLR
jgi:hypothetical protein